MRHRQVKRLLALLVLVIIDCSRGRSQAVIDDLSKRFTGPLIRAGIALNDEAALVRALSQHDDWYLASCASYALGRLPKSDLAVRELNVATQSDNEILMMSAIDGLISLGDRQWVSVAKSRLPNLKDRFVRVATARQLARAKVFDGWSIIESTIVAEPPIGPRDIALSSIEYFREMKEPSGAPIDMLKKLVEMKARAPSKDIQAELSKKILDLVLESSTPTERRK